MTSDGRINNSITAVKEQIERYFNDKLPNEACGLVVKKPDNLYHFVKCNNQAEKARDNFIISPEDFLAASKIGEVAFVVHSHPHAPATPSQADRVACERSGLPWWIVSVPYKKWGFCFPKGYKAPLIGRVFCHGILDCYALIRDWYAEELGIEIMDFDRNDEWWNKGENLYIENFAKAGFERIDDFDNIKVGDVILMQINSPVPNHGGVYIGNGMMLHHLYGKMSGRQIWGGYYRSHTTHVLRYRGAQ